MVAHYVRDVGVGRSSRLIPTNGRDGLKVNLALRPSLFYIESCAIQEFRPHHDLMHTKIKSWCGLSCNPYGMPVFHAVSPSQNHNPMPKDGMGSHMFFTCLLLIIKYGEK